MKDMVEIIRAHPFTEGLEPDVIDLIAGCARNVVFQAGDYVFRERGSADFFYLVRHGTVALELPSGGRGPVVFQTVKSGEILGASWLVPPYRWPHDARAVELTRAIAFECGCLRDKCERDHHVGYELMKRFVPILAERLHQAQLQGADVYAGPGPRDVAEGG